MNSTMLLVKYGIAVLAAALALAGAGRMTLTAQTGPASAPLYGPTNVAVGTVDMTFSSDSMQASIAVQGLTPNAAYDICVSAPATAAASTCWPAAANPGPPPPVLAGGILYTDSAGNGTATVAIPAVLPAVTVGISNDANPADFAQGSVTTGAAPQIPCVRGGPQGGQIISC